MSALEQKAIHEQLLSEWHNFKDALELQSTETKKFGEATAETRESIDKMNSRMDDIEAKMNRPGLFDVVNARQKENDEELERKAMHDVFKKALRKGIGGLDAEEKKLLKIVSLSEAKALSLGDDTAGGYLATPQFVADIIKTVILYSPIRTVARVEQTANRSLQIPTRTGVFAAQWVSETGQRAETKGLTYGLEDIPNFELYAEVLASEQMLEDSAFDMAAQISMETSEQFGVAEGKAFVYGTASGQPEGILTNPNIPVQNNGSATTLTYNGLVNMYYSLKDYYAQNAWWAMARATVGLSRQITDTVGRPIWDAGASPGLSSGQPPTLLGNPYIQVPDMPIVAANSTPIMFGNFQRGYIIVDRVSMVVKRLVEKYAETGQIAFLTRKRVGGQVVLPEAIIKLKMQ